MKYYITLFFSLLICFAFSQSNQGELLAKHSIKKIIIQGFEYQNDSLIKQTFHINELNKYGKTKAYKSFNQNDSLIRQSNYEFSVDGRIEFGSMLDKDGKLRYKTISIENIENRSLRKTQISPEGDTLVDQIWMKDRNWNDSILYRVKNNVRIRSYKWNYNNGGMLISKKIYDKQGDLIGTKSYTYKKQGKYLITRNQNNKVISKKYFDGNKEIRKILKSSKGYRAGIRLVSEKGGQRIETKMENKLLGKIEYFSKKGKLLALIKYTYIKS